MKYIITFLLISLTAASHAFEWPKSDVDLDSLLRKLSSKYKQMAEEVERRTSIRIESSDAVTLGTVTSDDVGLVIQLNPSLENERRITVLIWELANAFQRPRFDEIDRRANAGIIKTPTEFGLRMELVEYDSFRHHKEVLDQLAQSKFFKEGDFLFFINDKLEFLSQYAIPYVHDYIESQSKSGHTRHYEEWFHRQKPKDE